MRKKYYLIIVIATAISFLIIKLYTELVSTDKIWSEMDEVISKTKEEDKKEIKKDVGTNKFDLAIKYKSNIEEFKYEIIGLDSGSLDIKIESLNFSLLTSKDLPPECQGIIEQFIDSKRQSITSKDSLLNHLDILEKEVISCIYRTL